MRSAPTARTGACRPIAGIGSSATTSRWLRARARRGAELFDGYRVDHVIGFYRTYVRDAGGVGRFTPEDPEAQKALGRTIMQVFQASGAAILAEDLGTVPGLPARVAERAAACPATRCSAGSATGRAEGQPFLDPRGYAALSVTTTGTHDTESLAEWWDAAPLEERAAVLKVPDLAGAGFSTGVAVRRRGCATRCWPRSIGPAPTCVVLPLQDIFGWRDRINVPGTVGTRQLDVAPAVSRRRPADARRCRRARRVPAPPRRETGRTPH